MSLPERLTILHVDDGREWRGGQQQVSLLCREQAREGHRPVILCPPGAPLGKWAARAGIPCREAGLRGELRPAAIGAVRRAVAGVAPDVVHAHTSHAHTLILLGARGPRRPLRVVARRLAGRPPSGLAARLKYRGPVDLFIAVARAVARDLVAGGVDPDRIAVVPSAIDPDRFAAPPERGEALARLGLPAGCQVLGAMGSLVPQKGHSDLLAAFARLAPERPVLHLVILGEGPLRPSLQQQAARLGLEGRVRLPGHRADAGDLAPHFSVLALPSLFEGMPNALLDGLAAGVPVVATPAGGTQEVLGEDEAGLVVPFRSPRRLAAAVGWLLDHPEAARELVAVGRARVLDRHGPRALGEGTEAAYRRALVRRRGETRGPAPARTGRGLRSWAVDAAVAEDLRRQVEAGQPAAGGDWGGMPGPTGRGPVWRGLLGGRPALLKQHRRGGLPGSLLRRLPGSLDTLYLGDGRLFRTRDVTVRFRARGGVSPEPLGWLSRPRGPGRELYAATAQWSGGMTLDALLTAAPAATWRAWLKAAGRALARWHHAGLLHPDLNLGNVLVRPSAGALPAPDDVAVIDLDGARLRLAAGRRARVRSLSRLERSARKIFGAPALGAGRRLRLLGAYGREWAALEGGPPEAGDALVRGLLPGLRWRRWLFPLHRRKPGPRED